MKRVLTALLFAAATSLAQAVEVEGVKFEPAVQVGGQTLQLNGAGVRTRVMFKVYAAGLYVPQKSTSAATLLAQKGPRRVTIGMLRNVDADTFVGALNDGLKANLTAEQGTRILVNGQPRGAAIPGEGFFEAVLRIWIGDKPVDADLKRGMLGG